MAERLKLCGYVDEITRRGVKLKFDTSYAKGCEVEDRHYLITRRGFEVEI